MKRIMIACDLCAVTETYDEETAPLSRVEIVCRPDEVRDGHWELDACQCCRAGLHEAISLTIQSLSKPKPRKKKAAKRRRKS